MWTDHFFQHGADQLELWALAWILWCYWHIWLDSSRQFWAGVYNFYWCMVYWEKWVNIYSIIKPDSPELVWLSILTVCPIPNLIFPILTYFMKYGIYILSISVEIQLNLTPTYVSYLCCLTGDCLCNLMTVFYNCRHNLIPLTCKYILVVFSQHNSCIKHISELKFFLTIKVTEINCKSWPRLFSVTIVQ